MKKIEIFVRPEKVCDVCEALHDMGIYGIVLNESRFIDDKIDEDFEQVGDKIVIPPAIELVLTVPPSLVEPIVFTVLSSFKTGTPGHGKIIVSSIEKTIDADDKEIDESTVRWYN